MANEHGAWPVVQIDGSPLADEADGLLERVVVDDHLHLPDMFELRFRDIERDVLQKGSIRIGGLVTILAGAPGAPARSELIQGEVTAIEGDFDATGTHLVVRGYDASHRLHHGRGTHAYKDVTLSDVVREVASRTGQAIGHIDETDETHEHVAQANQSDWDFLKAIARETGFEVAVVDGKLDFRRPVNASDGPGPGTRSSVDPLQLVFGGNLEIFRPRITAAEQVKEVEVRGWDPARKSPVVGTAPASATSARTSTSPAQLATTFGDPVFVGIGSPLSTQVEVDRMANALSERIASASAEADGVAWGNPKLRAGTAVSVVMAGPFDGRYTLTSSRHIYDRLEGYKTQFTITGRQERSLLGLTSVGATNGVSASAASSLGGVVVAMVADVNDPDGLGRVKVTFPWLSDSYQSHWIRVCQMGAGKGRGAMFLPEVNDEVLVAFEHGDVRHPYLIGFLHNDIDRPDNGEQLIDDASGAVHRRGFMSKLGHKFVFFDRDGKSGLALLSADNGLRISLNETTTTIRIASDGTVEIEATGDISLKSGRSVSIHADGALDIRAKGISIDGGDSCTVRASQIRLN